MPQNRKQEPNTKSNLHSQNKHRGNYDFKALTQSCPELAPFVIQTKYGNESINFFDDEAVKTLNRALLKHHYRLKYWDIPKGYLCPPIPGRADYIHHVADLLSIKGEIPRGSSVKCLDIGVGASCIYPILGFKEYGWTFVGSDINRVSIQAAEKIIEENEELAGNIDIRHQNNRNNIFRGIIHTNEKFHVTICNPPFHSSAKEAQAGTLRKLSNLKGKKATEAKLNFGGQHNELWCEGGEKYFIDTMIKQSVEYARFCGWFSTLVSKEDSLQGIYQRLKTVKARTIKTMNVERGNKKSRIVAWSFQQVSQKP